MDAFATSRVAKLLTAGVTGAAPCSQKLDNDTFWDRLSFGIIVLGAALALLTFRDYGVTWDEDAHNWYGNFVLDYYLSFFTDRNALHWRDLYNYGAIFDTAAAALNRVSPMGTYETRHLLNALVGVVGLAGCYKLGHAMGGARVGFLASLFLLLTPNYYGQMFNNPKDIPFAVGMVWATYYMVCMVPALPRPPLSVLVKLGLAIGLALGVRVGGLLFLCYLGLLLALSAGWQAIGARRLAVAITTGWASLWRVLLPVAAIAFAVMLVFWPWAQLDQYVYYNAFVGGVDGAQRKFKLDYWANSYAEAVRGLETHLQSEY